MRKNHMMSHKESQVGKNLLGHEFATPQMSETSVHKRQNTAATGQRRRNLDIKESNLPTRPGTQGKEAGMSRGYRSV